MARMNTDFAGYDNIKARHTGGNGHDSDWRAIELVTFAEMKPQLDRRPLVKRWLDREQLCLIRGEAGCGKTFLALDIALHVAAGIDWFGHRVWPGAVVYVAAEAGRGIINRVAAFKLAHKDYGSDIPFAAVTSTVDLCHAAAGDVERLISAIRTAANLTPLALLVIDTVSRVLAGGNENAPDDMGALVRSLDRLRDELHCHVLAVHHSGKDQARGARGHSLLHCAVDTEIEIVRDAATGIATATITKQRDGSTEGYIAFQLRQVDLGVDQDGDPVTSCVIDAADHRDKPSRGKISLSSAQARALKLLADAITTAGEVPPPNNHIPAQTRCVIEDVWREYCYRGAISAGDQNAKRMAFKRCANTLIAVGRVDKWDPWVWLL
jgi:KaiC/GvpD/RAD55 family RecA-like ATPase